MFAWRQASATRGKDASGGCTAHAGLGEANGADDPAIQKETCGGRDSSEKGNLAVGEEEGEREGTLIQLGRQIRGRAADAGFTWSDGLHVEGGDNSAAAADEATDARARAMRHARPIYEVVCDDLKLLLAREVEDSRHDDEPGGRVVSRRGPAGGGDKGVEAVRQVGDQLSRRVGQLNSVGKFKTAFDGMESLWWPLGRLALEVLLLRWTNDLHGRDRSMAGLKDDAMHGLFGC